MVDVSPTSALAFEPTADELVSGDDRDKSLIVWDAETLSGAEKSSGLTPASSRTSPSGPTERWSPPAGTGRPGSGPWSPVARSRGSLIGHDVGILGVAVSPDGTLVATGSIDASTKLWDPATGEVLTLFDHDLVVNAVAFSPDGRFLASVSGNRDGRPPSPADRRAPGSGPRACHPLPYRRRVPAVPPCGELPNQLTQRSAGGGQVGRSRTRSRSVRRLVSFGDNPAFDYVPDSSP